MEQLFRARNPFVAVRWQTYSARCAAEHHPDGGSARPGIVRSGLIPRPGADEGADWTRTTVGGGTDAVSAVMATSMTAAVNPIGALPHGQRLNSTTAPE